jgi:hypothetical protein
MLVRAGQLTHGRVAEARSPGLGRCEHDKPGIFDIGTYPIGSMTSMKSIFLKTRSLEFHQRQAQVALALKTTIWTASTKTFFVSYAKQHNRFTCLSQK